MKIVSIMLVALMMLFTVAMANASENASEETIEKEITATEHAAEEVKETVVSASENATKAAEKAAPGFESIIAIAGLLAVASLVLSKRE